MLFGFFVVVVVLLSGFFLGGEEDERMSDSDFRNGCSNSEESVSYKTVGRETFTFSLG